MCIFRKNILSAYTIGINYEVHNIFIIHRGTSAAMNDNTNTNERLEQQTKPN